MKNKTLTTILLVTIIIFLIALYALLIQVFGIQSEDKATIIGGLLSMIGGAAGAMGAYVVASMQLKKQFEKQDKDRAIELRILKLNESLELTNGLLHILQIWRGLTYTIESRYNECEELEYSYIQKKNIFHDNDQDELRTSIRKLVSTKDSLKKNKIFLSGVAELDEIYHFTGEVAESNKQLLSFFKDILDGKALVIADPEIDFDEVIKGVGIGYTNLDKEIRNVINLIECEIKELLYM